MAITASAGFLAAGSPINATAFTCATVGTFLMAASASTFNQITEVWWGRPVVLAMAMILVMEMVLVMVTVLVDS